VHENHHKGYLDRRKSKRVVVRLRIGYDFSMEGEISLVVPCAGYLAYPFQNQEINNHAGNLNDTSLECRLQRKILVELSLALFIWNGCAR